MSPMFFTLLPYIIAALVLMALAFLRSAFVK